MPTKLNMENQGLLDGEIKSNSTGKYRISRWFFCTPILVIASFFYFMEINVPSPSIIYPIRPPGMLPHDKSTPLVSSGFLVDSQGCRIPALDPFDEQVKKYIYDEKPFSCNQNKPALVASNVTSLYVIESSLSSYNVSNMTDLSCCYRPFWRHPRQDNSVNFSSNCTFFSNEVSVSEEFVKVECTVDGNVVYKDFHSFVPLKNEVETRCSKSKRDFETVSVLILGVDAVSRLNLHRQMPRTVNLLSSFKAIEMLGYNKVDDNTFPNLVPALSGMSVEELEHTCWKKKDAVFDHCPWIWKNYSNNGYRTAFGEDAPWMGIFNYIKKGFAEQPTDYYLRPFQKLAEDEIGHTKKMNAKLCVGSRMTLEVLLGYVYKFVKTLSDRRYFSLFWGVSLSHDYLNYPKFGDKIHEQFFNELMGSGDFDNTVIVFMSDHGIRWGDIRGTYQGRLEERLPFLFFVFPPWFHQRYDTAVANLRRNARRLTTPFDLYETLKDLLDLRSLHEDVIKQRAKNITMLPEPPRGASLFLPGSDNRTCESAGIESHWCTCQDSKKVETTDKEVRNAALTLVKHLNSLLEPYRECASLKLEEIADARIEVPLTELQQKHPINDYVIVVKTSPGYGLFEATVRYRPDGNSRKVEGVVSRINTYGNQSKCVADYHMKLYCYCKMWLNENEIEDT